MTWVYLDDGFPEHPKVVAAGGDAAWLFVCAIAYCKRQKTNGFIPHAQIPRLSDRRQPYKLAGRLVEVSLLEVVEGGFRVHDWDDWNRASDAGKHAAAMRWQSDRNATAYAPASDRIMRIDAYTPTQTHKPTTTPAVVTYEACGKPLAAAEFDQVVEAIARRQLEAAQNVRSPSGWLVKARERIRSEHDLAIRRGLLADPVDVVVDRLEPPPKPRAAENPYAHFEDFTGLGNRQERA